MTLTQILQKIKSAFYTKSETESKLNAKANSSDLSNYLPLSGGAVFKGSILGRTVDNGTFRLDGGTGFGKGSSISLWGKDVDYGNAAGTLSLYACDGSQGFAMKLFPNGSLTWGDKNIEVIEEQGSNYIRYSSGIQILWAEERLKASAGETVTYNFPKSFVRTPGVRTLDGQSLSIYAYGWEATRLMIATTATVDIFISYMAIGYWK